MALYAITMNDGSVAVMQTVGDVKCEDEIVKWPERERLKAVAWTEIDPSSIPGDRTYRNAWRLEGKAIGHDMTKAREIHRFKMRRARADLLAKADVEYMRADEAGDAAAKARTAAHKQALRDVTADPAIEAAATIEELKAVWPDILKG